MAAPGGVDVALHVKRELARATKDRRRLLVYVGAEWCEPCVRFRSAIADRQLRGSYADLRFLEFDLDRDGEALDAAGYRSTLVPLIAIPSVDGRASGRQMEGGVKGEGAVDEMLPRLDALLR